ncbi:MAG: hypothetical protein ACT4PU_05805 [Planctomycetota bacterium]
MLHSVLASLRFVVSTFAAVAVLAALTPSSAQSDFRVIKIEVNQSIQTGSTPLVAGRATFVRASIRISPPPIVPVPLDGVLRVFVGGIEQPGSPIFSDNGPFPAMVPSNPASENGTLNFVFLPPQANNVTLTVQINPAGPNFVPESDIGNNTLSTAALNFGFQRVPEIAYAPIDYRPSGGSVPNPPPTALIEPGVGDNFVQGIYPMPDMFYHRIDAPTKLWTSSLASSGSPLLTALGVDINLMNPVPDFLYGWIPGGLSYNGQAIIGGDVSMGNTEPIRFQRTFAHELGHNFGLQHNSTTTGLIGVDVEHHLNLTQVLSQIKSSTLKDIMYAGLLTHEAWVASGSYGVFYNHPVFNPTDSDVLALDAGGSGARNLLVAGLWNQQTGTLELLDVLSLEGGRRTLPAPADAANLVVRTYSGGVLVRELPLAARTAADCGLDTDSQGAASPLVSFVAVLPELGAMAQPIDRVVVESLSGALPPVSRTLLRSPTAPAVSFSSPVSGDLLAAAQSGALRAGPDGESTLLVAWSASDADGEALRFHLRYSPDGVRFAPIATGLAETSVEVPLSALPRFQEGRGFFEVLASDGLNTSRARTAPLTGSGQIFGSVGGNPPWVQLITPDHSTTHLRGATVILHSSGWDLEDRGLEGESIQWTSSLDGALGSGRLLAVSDLSVGTHVLTVTATDGGALTAQDTATITVTDRGLPFFGGNVCQADLGFGGPGSAELSVCGGDLSSGTTADLLLADAPAFTTAWLVAGLVNGPVSFKGGLLVPVPVLNVVVLGTDGAGQATLAGIPGGGGPLSVYLQAIITDGGQPAGVGLSNAVRLDLLP